MTPEGVVRLEGAVANLEAILNTFADSSTRVRQRLLDAGWSPEASEAFVLGVTGPMISQILAGSQTPVAVRPEGSLLHGAVAAGFLLVGILVIAVPVAVIVGLIQ